MMMMMMTIMEEMLVSQLAALCCINEAIDDCGDLLASVLLDEVAAAFNSDVRLPLRP